MRNHKKTNKKEAVFLVAIDFSDCARNALRQTKSPMAEKSASIIALHVIDHDFITDCIRHELGNEGQIKKKLFMEAKAKLRDSIRQENMEDDRVQIMVSEGGVPYIEINRKAVENDVDMVIIGSCGNTGDMSQIFFCSTEEKGLRFITRPVLCVPPESEYRMGR
jgi:nucleotide-binding universal stress UspA family protein